MMKVLVSLLLIAVLPLAGCASLQGLTGAEKAAAVATRIMAGLDCVQALAAIAQPMSVDSELGFATASDAFNAVNKISDASKSAVIAAPCAATLASFIEDAQGAKVMLDAKIANPEPAPQRKARFSKATPKAQAGPVKVQVPLK